MMDYLFSLNPGRLYSQSYIVTLAIVLFAIILLGFWLLKKRRGFMKLEKEKRLLLHKAFKINLFLSVAFILLVVARILEINFISIRAFSYAVLLAIAIVFGFYGVKALMAKAKETVELINTDEYSKYLPHKKKK